MRRFVPALVLSLVAFSSCRNCDPEVTPRLGGGEQIDVFEQKAAAQVDILWVVDNSQSMESEQNKIASAFNQFFSQLITSQVDYHIGIVTTDPAERGVLRQYQGPTVNGCTGCRFVTKDIACPNPATDVSALTAEVAIEAQLGAECPAQLVFRKLIRVGIEGSAFEQGFVQAATALGVAEIDPLTSLPTGNAPAENAGFIRPEASLYVIFVSDEDEGAKRDGTPVHYYERLFESLKGAGNENKVAVASITGYPADASLPDLADVCNVLLNPSDARRQVLLDAFNANPPQGCIAEDGTAGDPNSQAELGSRYIDLACRTGGVIANMCKSDYSTALDALGANAAGLLRKFTASQPQCLDSGSDCILGTADDPARDLALDCDENGTTADAVDGVICVKAQCLGSATPTLVARSDVDGWSYESSTSSIRFNGGCVPAPGTSVEIRYKLREPTDTDCQCQQ